MQILQSSHTSLQDPSVVFKSPCVVGVYCQASTVFAQRLSNQFILSTLPLLSHMHCCLLRLELEKLKSYLNLGESEESQRYDLLDKLGVRMCSKLLFHPHAGVFRSMWSLGQCVWLLVSQPLVSVIPPPPSHHSMPPRMLSCTPTGLCTLTTRPGHCLRSPKNGCVFKVSEAGGR